MTRRAGASEEILRGLFMRHHQHVYAYAVRRTSQAADAEDVLSETFMIAWRRIRDVPPADRELPWLYAIARRVLANQRRSQQRLSAFRSRLTTSVTPVEERAAIRDDWSLILAALARLSDSEREIVQLTAWEGLSSRELAQTLGCSENAAAIRLHRARSHLADELAKEKAASGHKPGDSTLNH